MLQKMEPKLIKQKIFQSNENIKKKEIEQNNFDFRHLGWDTDYFGIMSGRITLKKQINDSNWSKIESLLSKSDFNVIDNINNNAINNFYISKLHAAFVTDINFQFTKTLSKSRHFDSKYDVYIQNNLPYNKQLLKISKVSYKHSRFFNDPYLNKEKASNIYSHWVESAFLKKDKYFVTCNLNSEILGYLLFSINFENKIAIVELISTRSDMYNRSIGKEMIRSLEIFLLSNFDDIKTIKVGTQSNNIKAINFYVGSGFSVKEIRSVYHYWPNKEIEIQFEDEVASTLE